MHVMKMFFPHNIGIVLIAKKHMYEGGYPRNKPSTCPACGGAVKVCTAWEAFENLDPLFDDQGRKIF